MYELTTRKVHGQPLYIKKLADGEHHYLYSSTEKHWLVTDSEVQMRSNIAAIRASKMGSALKAPSDAEIVWQRVGMLGYWEDSSDITCTEVKRNFSAVAPAPPHNPHPRRSRFAPVATNPPPHEPPRTRAFAPPHFPQNTQGFPDAPAAVTLMGRSGVNSYLMGVYEHDKFSMANGSPLYKKHLESGDAHFLFRSSFSGDWVATDEEHNIAGNKGGILSSSPADVPSGVLKWTCFDGEDWALDPRMTCTEASYARGSVVLYPHP